MKLSQNQLFYLRHAANGGLIGTDRTTQALYDKGLLKKEGLNYLLGRCWSTSERGEAELERSRLTWR